MALEKDRLEIIFKALGSRSRLRILEILLEKGEMHVSEISETLNAAYKGVSRNLNLLYRAGFLSSKFKENYIYYKIRRDNIHRNNLILIALLTSEIKEQDKNSVNKKSKKITKFIKAAMFDPRLKKLMEIIDE